MKKMIGFLFLLISWQISAQTTKPLEDFSSIKVFGNVKVTLVHSDVNKAEITVKHGEVEDLLFTYEDGKLRIGFDKDKAKWMDRRKAVVKLYYKTLNGIKASAGSNLKSEDVVVADQLDIKCSSGAFLQVKVKVKDLRAKCSSGGNMVLSGETNTLVGKASSGAQYNARDLYSNDVDVKSSSGANMTVWCNGKLKAKLSSGANLSYKGNPTKVELDAKFPNAIKKI